MSSNKSNQCYLDLLNLFKILLDVLNEKYTYMLYICQNYTSSKTFYVLQYHFREPTILAERKSADIFLNQGLLCDDFDLLRGETLRMRLNILIWDSGDSKKLYKEIRSLKTYFMEYFDKNRKNWLKIVNYSPKVNKNQF